LFAAQHCHTFTGNRNRFTLYTRNAGAQVVADNRDLYTREHAKFRKHKKPLRWHGDI